MSAPLPESGWLDGQLHRLPVRVYYEDTDTGGIVYHANYLRYLERGRTELLRSLGIDHIAAWRDAAPEDRLGFAVQRVVLDFRIPALLDDALEVQSRVEAVGAASVDARQWIRRGETRIAEATLRVALLDGTGRPRRLPAAWRTELAAIEAPSPAPSVQKGYP